MNHAQMELHFSPCTLKGTIRYTLDPGTDAFFILDDRFQITELTDDAGRELPYQKSPDSHPFRRQSCYTPKPSDTGKYTIKFESNGPFHPYPTQRKRSDRYNFFGENRIILYDNYLCFFPRLDFPDSSVRMSGRPISCVYEPLTAYGLEDY